MVSPLSVFAVSVLLSINGEVCDVTCRVYLWMLNNRMIITICASTMTTAMKRVDNIRFEALGRAGNVPTVIVMRSNQFVTCATHCTCDEKGRSLSG